MLVCTTMRIHVPQLKQVKFPYRLGVTLRVERLP